MKRLCKWGTRRDIDDFDVTLLQIFLQYMCGKSYQNRACFDKVIAKIKWCSYSD